MNKYIWKLKRKTQYGHHYNKVSFFNGTANECANYVSSQNNFKKDFIYDIENIGEDNPVPQLNINMIDKFADEYYDIESSCLNKHNKTILKDFINWLNFQKGVENSNEQPITITLPNSFFKYHGINPELMDEYHCICLINGKPIQCSLMEEEKDEYGKERYSYLG